MSRTEEEKNANSSHELTEAWDIDLANLIVNQDRVSGGGSLTDETLTERYLIKGGPTAALSVVHLSRYSADPRVRLAASTYIIDKVLGRNTQLMGGGSQGSPAERLMEELVARANRER